ncbi:M14 family metallopeptidase [Fulvivirgaceae bacterium BMA12]|uniref:M14 family metallopeptidase n=1 Tax=Agaribacillus aureus TaxID=3051825 RepID=A0ABT8LCZ1_9BACT|nr:M14 family metallopeptidase [Fulvivirgaceae bacterium BMA12]
MIKVKSPGWICLLILGLSHLCVLGQLKTPDEYLGYELGTAFTRHHRAVDYFNYVAGEKSNVIVKSYGETYEKRPLILAFISSKQNIDNLEAIRKDNLRRSHLIEGNPGNDKIAIVWLSYNVHGDESVSTEAALTTLYALADGSDPESRQWLDNTVVILDPCSNPDGRDRYVNWYYQFGNQRYNPDPNSKEHHQPWIDGRTNHYLFDLNRDWAWLSQKESQYRIKEYNKWMPHVHVDFHEQGINSPYYFAPAAEPYHEVITDWQREFQVTIGKNHVKYFDRNGWLYFTKEVFDLLYPSYGDTYPTYNGAIGMTYEQGGSGEAGLGVITNEGDTLTLKERIAHHFTTGLSTIEVTAKNAGQVVDEFEQYFDNAVNNPESRYKTYVIKESNGEDKLFALRQFLESHGISYGHVKTSKSYQGFSYIRNGRESFVTGKGDLIISAYQPKSRLLKSLFEPEPKLSDSVTYDITAWAIPYSFGLHAYATNEKIVPTVAQSPQNSNETPAPERNTYAYVARWNSLEDVKWLSHLLQKGVKVRFASESFNLNNENFQAGSLIITRRGNENLGQEFGQLVLETAATHNRTVHVFKTGFVSKGKDFGSNTVSYIRIPKVAVLSGRGVSPLAFGEVWHFFDQQIDFPITVLDSDYFDEVDLSKYDVLILPDGNYGGMIDDAKREELKNWVKFGGRLILMENALSHFADKKQFGLKRYNSNKEKDRLKSENDPLRKIKKFRDQEREAIKDAIFGSVFKTRLDNSHPLAFGYPEHYFTLKRSGERFSYLTNGWNVSIIEDKNNLVSGFSGANALKRIEKSLVFGVEDSGEGNIIYMIDNPLFRSFWHSGKLLFSNAVFLVGQ